MTMRGMLLTLFLTLAACFSAATFGALLAKRREWNALDWLKVVVVIVLHIVQSPFIFVFYMLRSAWQDAPMVGYMLRPRAMCKHRVDRNRGHCEVCDKEEWEQMMKEQPMMAAVPMNPIPPVGRN